MKRSLYLFFLILLTGCSSTPKVTDTPSTAIDAEVQARLAQWQQLIENGRNWPEPQQLVAVNDFVNQFDFVDDIIHWGQEDYWATPLETVVTAGGDCEDFAITKYFTLKEMGMHPDKLRLTYVKALTLDQAHMVVSYFERRDAEPLVLDNLNPRIVPASQRPDLLPVYSFNVDGMWLTQQGFSGQQVSDGSNISLWQQLLRRMDVEAADREAMICRYQYYDLSPAEARARC